MDRFDLDLLKLVQRDATQTAQSLAARLALSPSAIARRLRRLRAEGLITRTIALLSPQCTERRLRALVLVQLSEHADLAGKESLERRLLESDEVQFAYEVAGVDDLIVMLDCETMAAFNAATERLFTTIPAVRRYESRFIKREVKFAPFVDLGELSA